MITKILVFVFVLHSLSLIAQWETDVRLTNAAGNSSTSYNNARNIVSYNNILHVVWQDTRDGGNPEIYYKRSTNGGQNWASDVRLTNNIEYSEYPTTAYSDQVLHVLWHDNRSDNNLELFYKRSTDDGVTWGPDTRLTINNSTSVHASVFAADTNVHIVWQDNRDGNWEIYYKRSTDRGITWGADTRLTTNSSTSAYPTVTVSGTAIHITWYDVRDGNPEIYYKRSTDKGLTWGADVRLTNNLLDSYYSTLSVSGFLVHVVWEDMRDGNYEIYYKRSTDAGITWGTDTRITNNTASSQFVNIVSNNLSVHLVWQDNRDGNMEMYYKRSIDGGTSWSSDIRLTNNTGTSNNSSVSVSLAAVHIVWYDNRDGNSEIYYKRDPSGNPTAITNIHLRIPFEFKLFQNCPNPFNPVTKIQFDVPKSGTVNISVYDMLGRRVAALVNQHLNPGTYEADWNASGFPSGVYYYRIISGNYTETKKMVLIK